MAARVLKGAQLAVVSADDQHGVQPDAVLVPVAGVRDLVEGARKLPDARPQPVHLRPREVRGGVPVGRYRDRLHGTAVDARSSIVSSLAVRARGTPSAPSNPQLIT